MQNCVSAHVHKTTAEAPTLQVILFLAVFVFSPEQMYFNSNASFHPHVFKTLRSFHKVLNLVTPGNSMWRDFLG